MITTTKTVQDYTCKLIKILSVSISLQISGYIFRLCVNDSNCVLHTFLLPYWEFRVQSPTIQMNYYLITVFIYSASGITYNCCIIYNYLTIKVFIRSLQAMEFAFYFFPNTTFCFFSLFLSFYGRSFSGEILLYCPVEMKQKTLPIIFI